MKMKKKLTLLFLSLCAFLLVGSSLVNAQTEVWNNTNVWNVSTDFRGIAHNPVNNHIYVAGTPGSSTNANDPAQNYVHVFDAASGDSITTLTLEPLVLSGNGFGIRDVAISSDGGIFAICATLNSYNLLKIFYWASEDADPVQLWELPTPPAVTSEDFGTGFSVYGDFTEDALILIPRHDAANVWYFEITGGVFDPIYKSMDIIGVAAGASASAEALGTSINDGFWYNNSSLQEPSLIDGSGNIIGSIDAALFTGTTSETKSFSAGSSNYLVVSNAGNIQLIDVTGKAADFSDVTAGDFVEISGIDTEHPTAWGYQAYGYGQEQVTIENIDGSFAIYSLSGGNYVKSVATEGAPTASGLLLIGSPLVGEIKTANYNYFDINNDVEGVSEIKWFVADDAIGTNIAEITTNAGNMTYTLDAADAGKFISYTVLPVAATGTVSNPLHLANSAPFGPILTEETEPVAANTAITGTTEVGEILTASYDFSDAGSDLEGNSDYKWFRVDDNIGTNAIEVASESLTYTIQAEDAGKFIMFIVTPVSETGWPLVGDADTAFSDASILFLPTPPVASDVAISGRTAVEAILTGSYVYSDVNDDAEEGSILNWYSVDTTTGALYGGDTTLVAADTNRYEVVAADYRRQIWFEVTPVSVPTEGHDTGNVVFVATDTIAARPADYAPKAKDVVLSSIPEVGVLLSATYVYFDTIVNDPEGESIYKWYIADDASGTNATLIDGADDQTFLVTEAQLGKHFIFEVTPVAQTGGLLVGEPVQSSVTATATIPTTNTFGLERQWLGSTKTGAAPWYLNPSVTTERGMAVGSNNIYIASRYNGVKVVMVDKMDGSYVGELNTDGIEGGIYPINDIEVSDDGQILAAPLIDDGTFFIYKWENELAAPEKWLEVTLPEGWRMGDKFSVTGDLTGDAIILAVPSGDYTQIVRWVITGGIPAEAELITIDQNLNGISSPAAVPFTPSADANILLDGKGYAPTVFDKDGNKVGAIAKIDDYATYKIQSNSPNVFEYKGRTMAAFFQAMRQEPLGARIIVADITSTPYQIIDSTEYVSNSMAWDGYLGEVDVTVDGDFYFAYMLQAKNALAAYRGELLLPEFASGRTTHDGEMIHVTLDKALMEITMTDADPWTILADDVAVGIDSIRSGSDSIYFELTTAITEGQVITIAYDGTGSIASFNGMPLAAFGPTPVENIVGAEVPVASDVAITGILNEGETLTGTYTFTDPDGDLEGASEYQWYEATDASGTGALKILGEISETYTVTAGMLGKFVAFEVTPVSATGGAEYLVGAPAMSDYVEIVEPTNSVEESFATEVRTYPNPVQNVLNIINTEEISRISIIDISGKTLLTIDNSSKDDKVTIPMSEFNSGMYFVNLTGDNGQIAVKRIIKN